MGTRYTGYFSTRYSTTDGKLSPGEVSPVRSTTAEPRTPILVEGWTRDTKTGRLLCPKPHALAHDPNESHGARWLGWDEALALADEPALQRLLLKAKRAARPAG